MTVIAATLLALATATTGADGSTTGPAAPPVAAKPDNDPLVCRRIQELGSLLKSRKVCMRKSDWDEQSRTDKQMIDRAQVQRRLDGGG
ncbi:MAG: hypothetical protein RLZZ136_140 [Pseudomonadota bacterium]|jgi:predicted secreted protein